MGKIVLLAVAAAWAAVLIPPLIRSRVENRPNSSVTDFRRQLSTLQRAVPTRGMAPMRSIGRPLAQSPLTRPVAAGRSSQLNQSQLSQSHLNRGATPQVTRGHLQVASLSRAATAAPSRAHHADAVRRPSQREMMRRRRANVLFLLVMAFGVTLFLFATTKSDTMMYAFVLSFFSLMGYCYKLVQLRNQELDRQYGDAHWYNAA
jgi:hypothetical protein